MTTYTVPSGPFEGLVALSGELTCKVDPETNREFLIWDTHARTRHFLKVFDPFQGWKLVVTHEPTTLEMLDYSTSDSDGRPTYQPAWKFVATLWNPDDKIVANGSAIQLMNCPMSLEMGETRARSKLYTAMGLPGSPGLVADEPPQGARPATSKPVPRLEIHPVVDAATDSAAGAITATAPESAPVPQAFEDSDPQPALEETTDNVEPQLIEASDVTLPAPQDDAPVIPDHVHDHEPKLVSVPVTPIQVGQRGADKAKAKETGVHAVLLRQIEQRAKRQGVEVPHFGTLDQAQAFLASLIAPAASVMGLGEQK